MNVQERDRVRAQVLASRRAQGLQDTVPESQFLADLAAEVVEQAEEITRGAAA
jgi:hypothetical protein